jgi:hypothetical protein
LHRDGQRAHAEIVPRTQATSLIVWVNDGIRHAEDFIEWSGALERSDVVPDRLVREGWIDVT